MRMPLAAFRGVYHYYSIRFPVLSMEMKSEMLAIRQAEEEIAYSIYVGFGL